MKQTLNILICILLYSVNVFAQYSVKTKQLNDHLYALYIDMGGFTVNCMASIGPDGVLLVDTGYKITAQVLEQTLDSLGAKNADIILVTHSHVDHVGGNALLGKDAFIVAHENVPARMADEAYALQEFPDYAYPDTLFSNSYALEFNGDSIFMYAFPGSHSNNDAIVWFKESQVAYFGDLAYGLLFPSVDGRVGNAALYPEKIEAALNILPDDTHIISGHDRDCTMLEMKHWQRALKETINMIRDAHEAGQSVDYMVDNDLLKDYSHYSNEWYFDTRTWIQYVVNGFTGYRSKTPPVGLMYLALKAGGIQDAIAKYHDLETNHPDDYNLGVESFYSLGLNYLMVNARYDDLIYLFKYTLKEFPDWQYTWALHDALGEAYWNMGKTRKAKKYYQKSLKLYPENDNATKILALISKQKKP